MLRHFSSPTVKDCVQTFDLFTDFIKSSKHVMAMDAFYGNTAHNYLEQIGVTKRVIVNHYPSQKRTFRYTKEEEDWRAKLFNDLKNGKKVVVVSLGAKKLRALEREIKEKLEQLRTVCHTADADMETKQGVRNVEEFWVNFDCVLFSPTISAGVDFSVDHFDKMYLWLNPNSAGVLTAVQMTGRVRKLRDNVIELLASRTIRVDGPPPPKRQLRDYQVYLEQLRSSNAVAACATSMDLSRFDRATVDALLQIQLVCKMEKDAQRDRYFFDFKEMVEGAGHVVEPDELDDEYEDALEDYEMPETTEDDIIAGILAASDLESPAEIREVRARVEGDTASLEDRFRYMRYSTRKFYRIDRLTEEFLKEQGVGRNSKLLLVTYLVFPDKMRVSEANWGLKQQERVEKLDIIRKTLSVLGFKHPFDVDCEVRCCV